MSGEIYRPLIEDMTWSYSSLSSFHDCRYRWFINYIKHCKKEEKFYASYGLFMHTLLEKYYKNELSKEELATTFLMDFSKEVLGERPKENIVKNYIKKGTAYLKSFEPFPYKTIAIEKKIDFEINGKKFTCRIDYIGEDGDGNLVIIDNKSRDLEPRSKRKKPTVKDRTLDEMLRQLYLYSAAVKKEYGKFPSKLCFNCFKAGNFIEESFKKSAYEETIKWAMETIDEAENTEDFYPNIEYFTCKYICSLSSQCCYSQAVAGKR